ncbi:hypothetical protein GPECTOR_108g184 [Gonium pectorale]|uniref:Uncharacterized protein n=1 Tax=Gonium pectorale TaxID=33097 RepID=A0A150FZH6_GONPE|nr:hypothetical protein GPECTOR_108g184 [Gonium pectorale]|eukprot:KXZ42989.1 hypothetical protein GPECTOR_108g184 [Gonium pectorale]
MSYSQSQQQSNRSLVLHLDTFGRSHMAEAFGEVQPSDFPLHHVYFAYWNKTGIKGWSSKMDRTKYKEVPSYYTIKVNGNALSTVRDMKDTGPDTPQTAAYCLKGTLRDVDGVRPSASVFRIEIEKVCSGDAACALIPDPSRVFVSSRGHVAWSIWSVHQKLAVNGAAPRDHAWCPVQAAINLP